MIPRETLKQWKATALEYEKRGFLLAEPLLQAIAEILRQEAVIQTQNNELHQNEKLIRELRNGPGTTRKERSRP